MYRKPHINCKCKIIDYTGYEYVHLPTPGWKFQTCRKGHTCGKWKITDKEWEKLKDECADSA